MKTQLLLELADSRHMLIHFCESAEVEETLPELREQNIAVMEIDGSCLTSRDYNRYPLKAMKTQLLLELADSRHMLIHFCESAEVEETLPELREQNIAVMEIDGSCLTSREDVFKAFAIALRMPKGWYGDEEYAPNVDAFLEYLDDVVEWVPAKGHVVLIRHSEQLWRAAARVAGELVEWWQFSISGHQGTVHLVFVW